MTQIEMFSFDHFECLGYAKSFGYGGTRNSLLFIDQQNNKYIGKTNEGNHANVLRNEMISYLLAKEVGLSVPPAHFYQYRNAIWFLSQIIQSKKLSQIGNRGLRDRMRDWSELTKMLCYDILIGNHDRHHENILFAQSGSKLDLFIIDHDLALLGNQVDDEYFSAIHLAPCWYVPHEHTSWTIQMGVQSINEFEDHIQSIQKLEDSKFSEIVERVDDSILSRELKNLTVDFLCRRRNCLARYIDCFFGNWMSPILSATSTPSTEAI